jgi:hypothetical protein
MHGKDKAATIAGFLDEFSKIADAGLALEMAGMPGALYEGYRSGGAKGIATTGLGTLAGLGAGVAARHLIKGKLGPEFQSAHPLASTILTNLPLAIGSVTGGALGEHFGHHKVGGVGDLVLPAVGTGMAIHQEVPKIKQRLQKMHMAENMGVPLSFVGPHGE